MKGKKSLEEKAYTLVESDSSGFPVQISSQNREALVPDQIGETPLD